MGGLVIKELLVTAARQKDERLRRWGARRRGPAPAGRRVPGSRRLRLPPRRVLGFGGACRSARPTPRPCALPFLSPMSQNRIAEAAWGAVFYAVPHAGSRLADWGWYLR